MSVYGLQPRLGWIPYWRMELCGGWFRRDSSPRGGCNDTEPTNDMKKTIFLLLVSLTSALHGSAQNTSTLGLPGFNNSYGPLFSNQVGSAFATGNLNQLLLNLQA